VADLSRAPAPPPPRHPGDSESEWAYSVFCAWFATEPRPAPHTCGCAELAANHQWLARAQAHEWQLRLGFAQRTPPEILRDLVLDQIYTARIAAAKGLDAEAGSLTPTPAGEAALDRLMKLNELVRALPAPVEQEETDWTKLTQEERTKVLEAELLRRKARRGPPTGGQ